MSKNKKSIIIICIVLLIAIACGVIFFINKDKISSTGENEKTSNSTKLDKIYSEIENNSENYTLSLIINENNKIIANVEGDTARIEDFDNGKEKITIVKDGNTYILIPEDKKCYVYKNNTEGLLTAQNRIEVIKDAQENDEITAKEGTERINNREYKYEEYGEISSFLINYNTTIDEEKVKTRFYYDGDKLVYVKTTDGKNLEQLAKIEIEFSKNSSINLEIPSDYEIVE